jgi:F420-dependent oxidoreductase-like protein
MTTFGLQVPSFSFGGAPDEIFDRVRELAVAADESGFASFWVMDHLYQLDPLGGPDQPMLECYTLLGAVATVTERVTLGALVSGVTYRNPALLAKIVTTLDVISKGRAVLGLGAAWHEAEHQAFGFEFPPIGRRLDRVEDALRICRAMFTEDGVTVDGRVHSVRAIRNVPRPVQSSGPRILVGGGGEKRTLRLVAQYADACNIAGSPETIRHKLDVLRGHCEDVGRDFSDIQVTRLGTLMITDTEQEAAERRDMVAQMAGRDYVATLVVGTEESVLEQIAAYTDAGVDELIFNMPGAPADDVRRAGEVLKAASAPAGAR